MKIEIKLLDMKFKAEIYLSLGTMDYFNQELLILPHQFLVCASVNNIRNHSLTKFVSYLQFVHASMSSNFWTRAWKLHHLQHRPCQKSWHCRFYLLDWHWQSHWIGLWINHTGSPLLRDLCYSISKVSFHTRKITAPPLRPNWCLPWPVRKVTYNGKGTKIGITQSPLKEGAWSALSRSFTKLSERHLLKEVTCSWLLCPSS